MGYSPTLYPAPSSTSPPPFIFLHHAIQFIQASFPDKKKYHLKNGEWSSSVIRLLFKASKLKWLEKDSF